MLAWCSTDQVDFDRWSVRRVPAHRAPIDRSGESAHLNTARPSIRMKCSPRCDRFDRGRVCAIRRLSCTAILRRSRRSPWCRQSIPDSSVAAWRAAPRRRRRRTADTFSYRAARQSAKWRRPRSTSANRLQPVATNCAPVTKRIHESGTGRRDIERRAAQAELVLHLTGGRWNRQIGRESAQHHQVDIAGETFGALHRPPGRGHGQIAGAHVRRSVPTLADASALDNPFRIATVLRQIFIAHHDFRHITAGGDDLHAGQPPQRGFQILFGCVGHGWGRGLRGEGRVISPRPLAGGLHTN